MDKAELKGANFKNGLMSIDDVSIIEEIKKHRRQRDLYAEILTAKIAEEYDKCNIQSNVGTYRA